MEEINLVCEDSIEGIFTAIYEAYAMRTDHNRIALQVGDIDNYRLFCEYIPITTDIDKVNKVSGTLKRRLGDEVFRILCYALAAEEADKATAVYRTVVLGLSLSDGRKVLERLADDNVRIVSELYRRVWNETHHLMGFVRFQELENHILFAKIGPKSNVITLLADHFADRLPLEHFVIYDEIRSIFLIHPAKKEWFCVTGETLDTAFTKKYSDKEEEYQEMFRHFCHKIAIKERENLELQKQMLPLRFQHYMTEFMGE